MTRTEHALDALRAPLHDRLSALAAMPAGTRYFVIAECTERSRWQFVQFYGDAEKGLALDLPHRVVSPHGRMLVGLSDPTSTSGIASQWRCSVDQGTDWALAIFRRVWLLPPNAVIAVTIDQ